MLHKSLTLTLPFSSALKRIKSFVFDIIFYAIVGFSFLGCADFLGQQGIWILISLILMAIFIVLKGKITINIFTVLSVLFLVSYSIAAAIYSRDSLFSSILYGCLLIGLIQFFNCFDDKKKFVTWMIGAYVSGLFVSYILIVISTYLHQGAGFSGDVINHFWTDDYGTRTGISLYEIGAIGVLVAVLFFKSNYRKWYTIPLIIFAIVVCSIVSLRIGNRSFLVALFFLFFATIAFKMFDRRFGGFWTAVLIAYNILFVAFFLLYFLVSSKTIVLPDSLMEIKVIRRIFSEDLSKGRPELWGEFFSNFYKYPFGGLTNAMSNKYAHNIFLDFYTFGGVFSFLLSVTFFVFLFIDLFYFLRLSNHSFFEKGLLLCLVFAIMGLGMVEPIYQANPNCATPLFIIFLYTHYCHQTETISERKTIFMKEKREFTFFRNIRYFFRAISINWGDKNNKVSHSAKINSKSLQGFNKIGKHTYFEGELGKYSIIESNCSLVANIGRYSFISSNVSIYEDFPTESAFSNSPYAKYVEQKQIDAKKKVKDIKPLKKIVIGDDVWIGEGVRIKAGIAIGDGAIIESNSVVLEDVEPYTIVGGHPAKLIKQRFSPVKKGKIIKSQWTKRDLEDVAEMDIFAKKAKK